MKLSLGIHKQSFRLWTLGLIIVFTMLLPFSVLSQEEQQEEEINPQTNSQDQQTDRTVPVVGGALWENSAGSAIGTSSEDNTTTVSTVPSANRQASRPGAALRPDPPGNPDVPFSKNMNIVFLITGLVFAFWIARKKLADKTVAIKTNK